MCIGICIICVYMCVYIYIYIERERYMASGCIYACLREICQCSLSV